MTANPILSVEDDPATARLLEEAFKEQQGQHPIEAVETGQAALDFVHQRGEYAGAPRPRLVLLDINLPDVDGFTVLEEIKEDPELASIPVVMLSSASAPESVERAYKSGANAFVEKPPNYDSLVDMAQELDDFWFDLVKLPP